MKTEIINQGSTAKTYPYLGEHESKANIVLFVGPKSGVVVYSTENIEYGSYFTNWLEHQYHLFTGELKISN